MPIHSLIRSKRKERRRKRRMEHRWETQRDEWAQPTKGTERTSFVKKNMTSVFEMEGERGRCSLAPLSLSYPAQVVHLGIVRPIGFQPLQVWWPRERCCCCWCRCWCWCRFKIVQFKSSSCAEGRKMSCMTCACGARCVRTFVRVGVSACMCLNMIAHSLSRTHFFLAE